MKQYSEADTDSSKRHVAPWLYNYCDNQGWRKKSAFAAQGLLEAQQTIIHWLIIVIVYHAINNLCNNGEI